MLPSTTSPRSVMPSLDRPFRWFGEAFDDYELYEEDDWFVLTIDMPGFEREEIDLRWDEGVLRIAAEHEDEDRGRAKTYHRSFRLPKRIEPEEIEATYSNGVLEVRLPISGSIRGTEIEVQS